MTLAEPGAGRMFRSNKTPPPEYPSQSVGPVCGFVDESFGPAHALRDVGTSPWTTLARAHRLDSRTSRPRDQQY